MSVGSDDGGGPRVEVVIGWSVVALVHELIELGAILGKPQTLKEIDNA